MQWTKSDLNGEEIVRKFYKNNYKKKKKNQRVFRIENLIKRKGDKLYQCIVTYSWLIHGSPCMADQ